MVTVYHYMINDYHWLCVYCYAVQIYWYIIFNIRTPFRILWVINYHFYLHLHIHPNPVLRLLLILATQNNQLKYHLLVMYGNLQYSGCGLMLIQHLDSPRAVFATQPHPLYCIFCMSLTTVL